tara:strand:+ start:1210 stop:1542 length:333 start_codon:yes stop_codon:yes gene_type:complete
MNNTLKTLKNNPPYVSVAIAGPNGNGVLLAFQEKSDWEDYLITPAALELNLAELPVYEMWDDRDTPEERSFAFNHVFNEKDNLEDYQMMIGGPGLIFTLSFPEEQELESA